MQILRYRRWFFVLSLALIGLGVISMLVPPAFRIGIEFSGGSASSIAFTKSVSQEDLRQVLERLGHSEAIIQGLGDNAFLIRTRTLAEAQRNEAGQIITPSEKQTLQEALETELAPINTFEFSSVSPVIASETVRNAIIAVAIASIAILLYIWWAFRSVPNSFRMGATAIIAVVHDVLITLGIFSILGKFLNIEVNAMFITGILAVVGYSVNDTIVVFDRIRENTARRVSREMASTINISIMESLGRSLTTSITTMTVILALLLMGGGTIESLLYTLLIGVIVGTYSSIAIASQLLMVWEQGGWLPFLHKKEAGAEA